VNPTFEKETYFFLVYTAKFFEGRRRNCIKFRNMEKTYLGKQKLLQRRIL
jgi:hypothetical protein